MLSLESPVLKTLSWHSGKFRRKNVWFL